MSDQPVDPDVERLVAGAAARRFAPGFADRTMARVSREAQELVSPRQFLRLAAGVALAALLLGSYCIAGRSPGQSAIEALLGLHQQAESASIYDLDPMTILTRSDFR